MKFEYRLVKKDIPMSPHDMDKLGEEGWELCGILEYASIYHYYFKKLIEE